MKLLLLVVIAYAIFWAVTAGCCWLVEKKYLHKKGCSLCNRYGHNCGCGYLNKPSEKLFSAMQYLAETEDNWSLKGITFLFVFPFAITIAIVATHIVNPLHRRKCLADILNPPEHADI